MSKVENTHPTGNDSSSSSPLVSYPVWDRSTRWFHWINVLCILVLSALGLMLLNESSLWFSSEGKINIKIVHALTGYVFALNLLWRFVWGFFGNRYARWRAVLPGGSGYGKELRTYINGVRTGDVPAWKGHNPLGRLMVALLFLLLTTQMITGLVLAGTDLYFPPFGHEFAEWATGSDETHAQMGGLKPGAKEQLNPEGYAAMRAFRSPFANIHKLSFFVLIFAIFIHIAAVIFSEVKERNGLISAMFTGYKVFKKPPND